jgi:aminomethyltransferase
MTNTIQKTALHAIHQGLGAKMVPFAGFDMPVRYSSDLEEHHTVRKAAGVFDVSHMGEFRVKGPQAFDLVQWVTSNDVSKLSPGKIQYSCLPNGKGGIVDDLLVYCIGREEYLLVVNASNIEKDWNWISSQNCYDAQLRNESAETSLLAVQGPLAAQIIQRLTSTDLSAIPYYNFAYGTMAGIPDTLISNTGYTGAGGFELYVPNDQADRKESSQLALVPEIHSGWRWVFVSMETILTIRHHRSRQVLDGLPNSTRNLWMQHF